MTADDLAALAARAFDGKDQSVGCVVALLSSGSILIAMRGGNMPDAIAIKLSQAQAASLSQMIAEVLPKPAATEVLH